MPEVITRAELPEECERVHAAATKLGAAVRQRRPQARLE